MRIAISSDEHLPIVDELILAVQKRGHEVPYFGPTKEEKPFDWPVVTLQATEAVQGGKAEEEIILCWTGTGCNLIANKLPGIRAALCGDAETAKGARKWNHANVLGLSLRTTSGPLLQEILTAWFETPLSNDAWNLQQIQRIKEAESLLINKQLGVKRECAEKLSNLPLDRA